MAGPSQTLADFQVTNLLSESLSIETLKMQAKVRTQTINLTEVITDNYVIRSDFKMALFEGQ